MRYCPRCASDKAYSDDLRQCPEHGVRLSLRDPYRLVGALVNNKYQLEALLGVGGMGAVYLATHLGINRQVAFKILKPDLAASDASLLESFRREAAISGRLRHPNIVDVTDADVTPDGMAFMVMELLECPTLEDEMDRQPIFPVRRIERLVEQICGALQVAHDNQIIHRDLKPANIAVIPGPGGSETVKVLDFGIAKTLSEGAGKVSQAMGTPIYASPEQFSPGVPIDGRSDIYSLSVILYQLLTGTVPFRGKSVGEIVRQHLSAPPPPLRNHQPDLPVEIEEVILRGLAKKPVDRPASAMQLYSWFQRAVALHPDLYPVEFQPGSTVGAGVPASTLVSTAQVTLVVSGAPPKAEVKVNDWPRGAVDESGSLIVTDLAPGNHKLSIRRQGFEPWTVTCTCQPGERKEIKVSMKPLGRISGQHVAYSPPGGTLYDPTQAPTVLPQGGYNIEYAQTVRSAPPPRDLFIPARPSSLPPKNRFNIGLIIALVVVLGVVGVVFVGRLGGKKAGGDPPPPPPPVALTPEISPEYKETFQSTWARIDHASNKVLGSNRGQIEDSRNVISSATNDFKRLTPSPRIQAEHDRLSSRYDALIVALDNYSTSLRSYQDAMSSPVYTAGETSRGESERNQVERDGAAYELARQEMENAQVALSRKMK